MSEDGNDPRDNDMYGHEHTDDDDGSMPSLEEADPHSLFRGHNPFRAVDDDDPEEADISQMPQFQNTRIQNTGPGRYHFSATIHQTIPLSGAAYGQNGNGPNTIGGITSFLSNLISNAGAMRQQGQAEAGDGQGRSTPRPDPEGGPHVHRFTYSSGARLHPRDSNNPGPRLEPVDGLNNVLSELFAAFGDPNAAGQVPGHNHPHGSPGQAFGGMPMDPLMGLFAALSGGQHGDFVTSQEAMDRIVSQLMEQTANSNAPGPASQADIDALPRKKITIDMLGDDGNADCSICMDSVAPEEEVTELPCRHWFHHQCVSAWLKEHDTCPHCRKGITKTDENGPKDASSSAGATAGSTSSGADPTVNMPGAFGVIGEGTSNNPFVVPGSSPPGAGSSAQQGQSNANDASNNNSSAAERRGWWP
ncbi:uncharacterized protein N0V89_005892 [Didymosphaeria variabile]|uniref:RING-type E3 ubiquitin transferase n=1 Tax=Didymosphaeria variabile TaxID=1932322 RepID=A0A9W9CBX2_9PLEO|nr:uncharacterized protein N0V89_005892 [Didymosphaeria variabile]KAJ4354159.1 hypothetical protein N0V89_005892 [Didymosphaeria variabile]